MSFLKRRSKKYTCMFKVWICHNIFSKLNTRKILYILLHTKQSIQSEREIQNEKCEDAEEEQKSITFVRLMTSVSFSPEGKISSKTHILTSSEFFQKKKKIVKHSGR